MGDFDLWRMMGVHETFAVVWFFAFELLVLLLMLNMLLAIVMDVYIGVKSQSTGTQTVWAQAAQWINTLYTIDEYDAQVDSREILKLLELDDQPAKPHKRRSMAKGEGTPHQF